GVLVVDLTISRPDVAVPRVACDNLAVGRLAAAHFEERRFRRVVWFSSAWSRVHELRWRGLSERVPAERWVLAEAIPESRNDDWKTYSRWVSAKLESVPKPFAALTYGESDAARLLDAAMRAGISVPEELAILSVGNDPAVCENQPVPLSSIDQNIERGAYEGAALLARLMDGEPSPAGEILVPPAGVVLRRSTDSIAVSDPLVRRALDFVAAHLSEPIGAAQVCDALGAARSSFDKRFTAEMGRSVGAEILRQRMAKAKLLLRDPGFTIARVAATTGFCSPSHFANAFRAANGTTPGRWRLARQDGC
ncbi:MAG: substrate-binding domain-containing protein, partial [Kiritimatiellae bacterium]|nr:substrate-binding domain-containing protein [Kiritimatiellia bacterium]